jgi:menaquinone-dependent protoporphyrinogen oxidase
MRMMRVLVAAATKYGATAEIAQTIADVLGEHGLEATVLPPDLVEEVDGYDAVVLGSAVYAGHWLKPARELVERHADGLAGRCGCSPAARSGTHRSRKRIRWMWPSSRV